MSETKETTVYLHVPKPNSTGDSSKIKNLPMKCYWLAYATLLSNLCEIVQEGQTQVDCNKPYLPFLDFSLGPGMVTPTRNSMR